LEGIWTIGNALLEAKESKHSLDLEPNEKDSIPRMVLVGWFKRQIILAIANLC
jgi:hypothetical protein